MSEYDIFSNKLLQWFDIHGRHDLPWQVKNHPYKVWVSEIMLQQTQVKTVLQYYDRFIARFPTVEALAHAEWEEVAPYWAGLGYYARARNLHKAARQVGASDQFPDTLDGWMALSGIGRSTGGALMSLGLGKFGVILDGNVKRVLSRYYAISGDLSKSNKEKELWHIATALVPQDRHADYTQAIMDLGATICTPKKPLCLYCPMREDCQAYRLNDVLSYPEKKAKKIIPIRQGHVMIFEYEQQWLWLQRPNQGLWGGLYCLPIIEAEIDFQEFLQRSEVTLHSEKIVTHQFTHFTWHLNCHKFLVDTSKIEQLKNSFDVHAYSLSQIQNMGIPTAMQKVITAFCQN